MRAATLCLAGGAVCLAGGLWGQPAAAQAPAAPATPRCIAIVGTNDLHGALTPTLRQAPGDVDGTPATVRTGGVAALSGYLRALRQAFGERLLLLDAGDLFQGSLASNMSEGRAVIAAYNQLGYQGAAIGNHEFDFGSGIAGGSDPRAVLKARIAAAQFPFFSLNVFDAATKQRITWPNTRPSVLLQVGEVRVGVLGISTVDTPHVTRPRLVDGLRFLPPAPLVEAEAQALRRAGAELIVLVGHLGGACHDLSRPDDPRSCDRGELLTLLRRLPRGTVDVAIGGHTHQFIAHWVGDTATLESGARGNYLGYVTACVRPGGGIDRPRSTLHGAQALCLDVWANGNCRPRRRALLPIRPARFLQRSVEPQRATLDILQPYLDAVQAAVQRPLAARLPRPLRAPELASLTAEAMRATTHSDFACQNREGVRAELPAGPLHYGQVFEVLPFDNQIVQLRLTGAQIEQLVANVWRHAGRFGSAALAGLAVPRQVKGRPQLTTSKGKELEPSRIYTLATSDFMAEGGDAGSVLQTVPSRCKTYFPIDVRQALIDYLTAHAAL